MWTYEETKDQVNETIKDKGDLLDQLFIPMAFALNYRIAPSVNSTSFKKGMMVVDHRKGQIIMRPDNDSEIIFYGNTSGLTDHDQIQSNEIHIYLDNSHIVFDLPRFGAISRQSEIVFDDSEKDKMNYKNLINLIDYQVRSSSENHDNNIKFMDKLQFRDDISSVVSSNGQEHLRFIKQLLNDSLKSIDSDLIDFLMEKIKKKFDPLDDKETESHVRELMINDFKNRNDSGDCFMIVDKKQFEESQDRKQRERNQVVCQNDTIVKSISEIFDEAKKSNKQPVQKKVLSQAPQDIESQASQVEQVPVKKQIQDKEVTSDEQRTNDQSKSGDPLSSFFG